MPSQIEKYKQKSLTMSGIGDTEHKNFYILLKKRKQERSGYFRVGELVGESGNIIT